MPPATSKALGRVRFGGVIETPLWVIPHDDQASEQRWAILNGYDLARLLDISIGRLRNKLTSGSPLPPRIQPPGCRTRLWPWAAVQDGWSSS